jgi:hypothetical protein
MGEDRLLLWAGGLSIAAALLHGAIIQEHFLEWPGYGAFFMFAMAAQGIYGLVIVGTRLMEGEPLSARWPVARLRLWYLAGIVGNVLLVLLYVESRTLGIPAGPQAGEVEAVTPLGVLVKLIELALVGVLVALLWRTKGRSAAR